MRAGERIGAVARLVPALLLVTASWLVQAGGAGAQHVEDLDTLMRRAGVRSLPGHTAVPPATRGEWGQAAVARGEAVEGSLPVLLVPGLFEDSGEPPLDTETLREVFFTGPSERGTLPEFFTEASGGAFTVTGNASPWHRTEVTLEEATGGSSTALGIGPEFGAYLLDAIQAADQTLDFGEFDNDGPDGVPNSGDDDGRVDALSFIFAEVGRSCGGPGVWPHKAAIAVFNDGEPYTSDDPGADGSPIEANGYVIVSGRECDGSPVKRVAVIAHELGHELGLPDLYHPTGSGVDRFLSVNRRWVVGCWGLMAGGSWGCGPADEFPAFGPTHFSAWARDRLGWIDLATAPPHLRRTEIVLEPVLSSRSGLRIPLDGTDRESLLIELRTREGFDAALPTEGVLIYRWVPDASFRPPVDGPKIYRISLLEADGDSTLLNTHHDGGNRGEASDAFATDGESASLSAVTHPGTRFTDGTASTVTIHEIAMEDGRARLVLSTTPTPDVVNNDTPWGLTALEEQELRVPLGGGALPYTLEVREDRLPVGVGVAVDGDELVFSGTPRETGSTFQLTATLTDGLETTSTIFVPLEVARLIVSGDLLIEGLASPSDSALSAGQREVLDRDGNENGGYDAGDLRAYLFGGA